MSYQKDTNSILFFLSFFFFLQTSFAFKNSSGFTENKQQITDQYGKPRKDIRYIYNNANFKLYLKENSFSYEVYTTEFRKLDSSATKRNYDHGESRDLFIHSHRIDIELLGANKNPEIIGEGRSQEYYNYYTSGTPAEGATDVHKYEKVIYKNIYKNIDLVFYTSSEKIKYDFIVRPGADASAIQLLYKGASAVALNKEGNINIFTTQGNVEENIPLAYEKEERKIIKAEYVLNAKPRAQNNESSYLVSFHIGAYNKNNVLVIDPQLIWATYYGGNQEDQSKAIVTDAAGNPVTVGYTSSAANIATVGANQLIYGGGTYDAFLCKMNAAGTALIWATYYGGSAYDSGNGIVIDANGDFYIAGETLSPDNISTAGTFKPAFSSPFSNAFIAKFTSAGVLAWGTYYGNGITYAQDIMQDANGDLLIGGATQAASGIATAGAYQTAYGGNNRDAWLLKLTNDGITRLWATYYGGSGYDEFNDVYTDAANNILATGETQSTTNIASAGAHQTIHGGGMLDAFVVKLDAAGVRQWATYYGGPGNDDWGQGIVSDASNNIYVCGKTSSTISIATPGTWQSVMITNGTSTDAFIVKFDPTGVRQWGSYYGGNGNGNGECAYSIVLDASNNIFISGQTNSSTGIACAGAYDDTYDFNEDAFAAKFDNTGTCRIWGTYYGGLGNNSPNERAYGITLDNAGNILIAGFTDSSGGASGGAYQTTYGTGLYDAFILKLLDINCNNCIVTFSISVSQNNIDCNGNNTGSATVTTIGGSSPYSYLWSTGKTEAVISQLAIGNYSVVVTDGSGATAQSMITISQPSVLTLTISSASVSCYGTTTGSASANAGGGTMPYKYNWSNGKTSAAISNLAVGNYTVTVTDNNGCTVINSVLVTEPPTPISTSVTATSSTCGQSDGYAIVIASGGTGAFTYMWSTGDSKFEISTLQMGSYSVTTADANGCTTRNTTTINNLNGVSAQIVSSASVTCNGLCNGSATANGTGGSASYTFLWSNGKTEAVINNLCFGVYSVTVTDNNGCSSINAVTISEPAAITLTLTSIDAGCGQANGFASVNAFGGAGTFSYSWSNGGVTYQISNLASQIYSVTVTDSNSCIKTGSVTIFTLNTFTIAISGSITIQNGESTPLSTSGGLYYQWYPATGLNCATCQNPTATPSATTLYCVTVTDINGCSDSACVTVNVETKCAEFFIPTAFSPNGDNNNDCFLIYGTGSCFKKFFLTVYDRWGEKVFTTNDPLECWNGISTSLSPGKNKELNTGIFVYYLNAITFKGEEIYRQGNISLIR